MASAAARPLALRRSPPAGAGYAPPAAPPLHSPRAASARTRIPQLDVLRGVAILLVLGRHMEGVPLGAPWWVQDTLYAWRDVGWTGVDLFFVLSGFLVSGLLFREYDRHGDVQVARFLARRALKIYPAFYGFLVATSLYAGTLHTHGFVAEALFVQNYRTGLWDHTWSLAVEEHFYLLLAGLAFILARRRSRIADDPFRTLVPIFASVAIVALALRIVTARFAGPWYTHHLCPTHLRLDSLLFGVLLSYLAHYRRERLAAFVRGHRTLLFLLCTLCLMPVFFLPAIDVFMETAGFSLIYLGFGGILLLTLYGAGHPAAATSGGHQIAVLPTISTSSRAGTDPAHVQLKTYAGRFGTATVGWIGVYSYSIYLWHLAVKRWAMPAVVHALGWSPTSGSAFVAYLVVAVACGALMARLVEVPVLAVRDRWVKSRA